MSSVPIVKTEAEAKGKRSSNDKYDRNRSFATLRMTATAGWGRGANCAERGCLGEEGDLVEGGGRAAAVQKFSAEWTGQEVTSKQIPHCVG